MGAAKHGGKPVSGGGKKQTIGYWYRLLYHFGFCKGPIDAFLEFRAGDRTAWSGEVTSSGRIRIDKANLFGGEKSEGGLVGDFDLMFGESDQQANDYLAAKLGPEQPTYRGKATGVWRGGRYGAMNPYPKAASFKIRRALKGWDDDMPWYPGRAEIIMSSGLVSEADFGPTSSGWRYKVVALTDTNSYSSASYDDSGWSTGQAPFASAAGHPYSEDTGFPAVSNTSWPLNTKIWIRRTFNVGKVGAISLIVFVDNYATVWVNGHLVLDRSGTINGPSGPIFTHEISIPANILTAGNNVIAVMGEDFGSYSYLAIKINATGNSYLVGMNPAHILYDSITARDMANEPVGLVNDESFRAAADKLYTEGFGLCTSFEFDTDIEEFQQRICDIIGACLSQSRVDGQYYLDLIRGDYVLADLPIISEDDVLEFSQTPTSITEVTNSIVVEWFDPEAKEDRSTAPIQTLGAIMAAGGVIPETRTYREIPTEELAIRVGQRDLQATATPINRFNLTTNKRSFMRRPGQSFRLQMPSEGIADMVCVVGDFETGTLTDGRQKITAVQDVFGFPSTVYIKPETGLATPADSLPIGSPHQVLIEAPYVELVANLSAADLAVFPSDAGAIMVAATRPTSGRNYVLWTAATGEVFDSYGLGDWCPSALVVEEADRAGTSFTLSNGSDLDNVEVGTWALWGTEIVRIDAFDSSALTMTIGRGCADTVPVVHAPSARIYFCGDWGITDGREYVDGETVQAKLLTRTASEEQSLDDANALSVELVQRQFLPYPPAAVTVNGLAEPGELVGPLTVAWRWRDRLLQNDRLVDQAEGNIGPESGTTARVRYYRSSTLLDTQENIATDSTTYTPSDVSGLMRIEVEMVRDGLASLQMWVTEFPFSAGTPTVPEAISIYANLVSWWGFDDNQADLKGQNSLLGAATYAAGKEGKAIQSPTRRRTPTKIDVASTVGGGSLFGWIYLTSTSTLAIASLSDSTGSAPENIGLSYISGSGFQGFYRNSAGTLTQFTESGGRATGAWYFIAAVWNGSDIKLYVNNVLLGTTTGAAGTLKASAGFQFGSTASATNPPGHLDLWGYSNAALTAAEVAYLYNSGAGRSYSQLVTDSGAAPSGNPPYASVVSLLHFNGADASTSIVDEKGKVWTAAGGAQLSTTNPKWGTACLLLNGVTSYVTTPAHADFNLGSGDFTWEGFLLLDVLPATYGTLAMINCNTNTYAQVRIGVTSAGKLSVLVSSSSAGTWLTTDAATIEGGAIPVGTRCFIRVRRVSGVIYGEIDRDAVLSYPAAVAFNNYNGPMMLGAMLSSGSAAFFVKGRLDDVRLTKGVSVVGPVPTEEFPNA